MTSLLPPTSEPDATVDADDPDAIDPGKRLTEPRPRPAAIGALLAVGWTAPAGALLCAGIAVAGWLLGGQTDPAGAPTAARLGTNAWLLTHHAPIEFTDGTFALAPLGLGAALAVICFLAGGWIARTSELERTVDVTVAIGCYTLCYGGFAALVAVLSRTGSFEVSPWQACWNAGLLAGIPAAAGILAERGDLSHWVGTSPPRLRTAVRAAAYGTGLLLASGTLLVLVALIVNGGRISEFGNALRPGVAGWLVLALLCLVYLPNAVLYAVSYLLGPGFALGVGTVVSPTAVELGPLPTFPLLAAVPGDTEPAPWLLLVLLVPLAAGGFAGSVVFRRHPGLSPRSALLYGGGTGVLMALTASFLVTLAGGSAGPGRMAEFGATTAWITLTSILLCGASAVSATAWIPLWRWWGATQRSGVPDDAGAAKAAVGRQDGEPTEDVPHGEDGEPTEDVPHGEDGETAEEREGEGRPIGRDRTGARRTGTEEAGTGA